MNNLAVVPYVGMHALQIQNVKRNIVKKASISELNYEKKEFKEFKEENKLDESSNNVNGSNLNGTNINDLPQASNVIEPSIEPSIEPFSDNSNLNISALE
jgi:hypothetical protein